MTRITVSSSILRLLQLRECVADLALRLGVDAAVLLPRRLHHLHQLRHEAEGREERMRLLRSECEVFARVDLVALHERGEPIGHFLSSSHDVHYARSLVTSCSVS